MNRLAKTIEDLGLDPTQPYTIQFLEEKLKEREEKLKMPAVEQEVVPEAVLSEDSSVPQEDAEKPSEEAVKDDELQTDEVPALEETPEAETSEVLSEEKPSPKKSGRPKKST